MANSMYAAASLCGLYPSTEERMTVLGRFRSLAGYWDWLRRHRARRTQVRQILSFPQPHRGSEKPPPFGPRSVTMPVTR
jgi:hypothetical protein